MKTATPTQLGMVGLGRMGANIVRRLMRDGHECVVYDVNADAVKELATAWPTVDARPIGIGQLLAPVLLRESRRAPGPGLVVRNHLRTGREAVETRAAADLQMQIAMAPGVDSLNVATAAAIALHRLRSAAAR